MNKDKDVPSPCVRMCCLDEKNICLGCYRTLDEILEWSAYSAQDKARVIARCDTRRKALDKKRKS
ncbi:hypothetical protein GCM10007938_38560 [Vibrio zhanjiangensis]|uniref:DUF1289 domain-containing protein n=1 Tax=Vibrio zhanjiangensis TaxID=1046128 RepID=A0ABQ6F3I2_9VIBR|nr:DUF1289 domain-containing protein [Vibrio zhanjiangensis]GLT20073.1 hypothetical protein GCM10007938_38560 [Vibrio zhanjiangensis]